VASSEQVGIDRHSISGGDRYQSMAYRRAGNSGLLLSTVSLGLWKNFGFDRPFQDQRAIVLRSFDLGIVHFDLANNYGPPGGSAETAFGAILRSDLAQYRDEIIVSTKAGYRMWPGPYGEWGSRKNLLASLDQSLSRLGLDYVDVYYHHRPDPDTDIDETIGALASAVTRGKALYAGISNYSPAQTRSAVESAQRHGVRLVLHQPSYSMFNRHVEDGLLDVLDEVGMGSVVFSPLQQGLLTDRYLEGHVPADSRAAANHGSNSSVGPVYLERVRGLQRVAQDRGQTLAQLALTWVLRHPAVTSAVIGASTLDQLEQNIAAVHSAPLTADELAAIEEFAVDGTRLRESLSAESR
jgi:L-glyceraldehyde 3-phosphate reductase